MSGCIFVCHGIEFVSFYEFSLGFWNCSDSLMFFFFLRISTVSHKQWFFWYMCSSDSSVYFIFIWGNCRIVKDYTSICTLNCASIYSWVAFCIFYSKSWRKIYLKLHKKWFIWSNYKIHEIQINVQFGKIQEKCVTCVLQKQSFRIILVFDISN